MDHEFDENRSPGSSMAGVQLSKSQIQYIQDRRWKRKRPEDHPFKGDIYRSTLANMLLYPNRRLTGVSIFDREELLNRAVMHQMIDELTREDLSALMDFVRTLCIYPGGVEQGILVAKVKDEDQMKKEAEYYGRKR